MTRGRRWIVLVENGEHSTIGRQTDPGQELLDTIAGQLRDHGLGGWLAVLEGDYYGNSELTLLMVRELAPTDRSWSEATIAFLRMREERANAA